MNQPKTIEQVPITKLGLAHYMRNYDEYIGPMRGENLHLLELGIAEGDSLRYWASWLPRARIVGLDIRPRIPGLDNERIVTYQGEQQDRELLDRIGREQAPQGFDVIVDDASHIGQLTRISFWHLFDHHLKPGGYYFIEDWGTGYWSQYVDGRNYRPQAPEPMLHERLLTGLSKTEFVRSHNWLRRGVGWTRWHSVKRRHPSHQYGMVGFIKELVDECAMMDITRDDFGVGPQRPSRFEWLRLSLGHAIIRKPLEAPAPHDA